MFAINYKQKRINVGIILIEMMLCVFLETIILSLLIEIYIISIRTYDMQQSIDEIEDHAQSAIEILSNEMHLSGYIGCPRLTKKFPFDNVQANLISSENKIYGTSNEITLRHAGYPVSVLLQANDNNKLIISNDIHVKQGDLLIISNCSHADIIKVQRIDIKNNEQIITPTEHIDYSYQPFTEVSLLVINRFYTNKHALFLQTIKGKKIKLVDDVSNIHFLYTIKYANKLLPVEAASVSNWGDVIGVSMEIEIESKLFKKKWYAYSKIYT